MLWGMQRPRFAIFLCLAVLCAALSLTVMPARADTQKLPLWEAGMGIGNTQFHLYPGAKKTNVYTAGWPYLIYRGEHLRASGRNMKLVFFETEHSWLDLSAGGWIPVDNTDEPTRVGLPDLATTLQAGPRWNQRLGHGKHHELVARLALRRHWSVAGLSAWRPRGEWLEPSLKLTLRPKGWRRGNRLGFSAGAVFASADYNRYVYGVAPNFATATRPAYRASGGFNWTYAHISIRHALAPRWWLNGFVSVKHLGGGSVQDSPLVSRQTWVGTGIAITWIFAQSKMMVPHRRTNDGKP